MTREDLEEKIHSLQADLQKYQDALTYRDEINVFLDEFNIRTLSGLRFARKILIRSGEYPDVEENDGRETKATPSMHLEHSSQGNASVRTEEKEKNPEVETNKDLAAEKKTEPQADHADTDSEILSGIEDMFKNEDETSPEDLEKTDQEEQAKDKEDPKEEIPEKDDSEETSMNWNFGDDNDTIAEEIVPDDKEKQEDTPAEEDGTETFFEENEKTQEETSDESLTKASVSEDIPHSEKEPDKEEKDNTAEGAESEADKDLLSPDTFAKKIAGIHSGNDLAETFKHKIAIARAEENIAKTCANVSWDLGISGIDELSTLYGGNKKELDDVQSSKEAETLGRKMFESLSSIISEMDTPHAMDSFKAVKAFPDFIIFKAMYAFAADVASI